MKNISLKKLSITVIVASLASNVVFADNDMSKAVSKIAAPASSFSQLITDYDTDKSNTLSAKELTKNDKLTKVFAQIDTNGDKEISEEEFNRAPCKNEKVFVLGVYTSELITQFLSTDMCSSPTDLSVDILYRT